MPISFKYSISSMSSSGVRLQFHAQNGVPRYSQVGFWNSSCESSRLPFFSYSIDMASSVGCCIFSPFERALKAFRLWGYSDYKRFPLKSIEDFKSFFWKSR